MEAGVFIYNSTSNIDQNTYPLSQAGHITPLDYSPYKIGYQPELEITRSFQKKSTAFTVLFLENSDHSS
jgi:hypothetical protein